MIKPKTLTGVIRLPDTSVHFYMSFGENGTKTELGSDEAKGIGRMMSQAEKLPPEMQEILVKFAEFLEVDLSK